MLKLNVGLQPSGVVVVVEMLVAASAVVGKVRSVFGAEVGEFAEYEFEVRGWASEKRFNCSRRHPSTTATILPFLEFRCRRVFAG